MKFWIPSRHTIDGRRYMPGHWSGVSDLPFILMFRFLLAPTAAARSLVTRFVHSQRLAASANFHAVYHLHIVLMTCLCIGTHRSRCWGAFQSSLWSLVYQKPIVLVWSVPPLSIHHRAVQQCTSVEVAKFCNSNARGSLKYQSSVRSYLHIVMDRSHSLNIECQPVKQWVMMQKCIVLQNN